MTDKTTGSVAPLVSDDPQALLRGLRSPAALQQAQQAETRRSNYQKAYWKTYSQRMKRVSVTIPRDVHATIVALSEANGRTPGQQIWAESCAYRRGAVLPSQEVLAAQQTLIAELRRVGNNLNQLARLGHIEERRGRGMRATSGSGLGVEALRQLERLERAVARFETELDRQRSSK